MSGRMTRKVDAAPTLRDSVEQIWLAGLGAVALSGDEGSKLFHSLVKRGSQVERSLRKRTDALLTSAKEFPTNAVSKTSEVLENGIDEGMGAILARVGIPSKREITALTRRVEGLTAAIEKDRTPARRVRPPRRKAAPAPAPVAVE